MKIVLDTNVLLVSISRKSEYFPIFDAFLNGHIQLCVTTDILFEYAELLASKFHPNVMDNIMKTIEKSPDIVQITKYYNWQLIKADPDDDKFVDCAVAANVDYLVTNDKHFKVLATIEFPLVNVLSAEVFLQQLLDV